MSFRFLITDLFAGDVKGTNDPETAKEYAASDDFFVVDCETREWIGSDGEAWPISSVRSGDEDEH